MQTITLPECTLRVATDQVWAHLAVAGEIDVGVAEDLLTVLRGAITSGHSIQLDLSEVTFIDSSGLVVILNALAIAREFNQGFTLRAPLAEPVERLARLCGVLNTLPLSF